MLRETTGKSTPAAVLIVACALVLLQKASALSASFCVPLTLSGHERPTISMSFEEANPHPETLRLLEFASNLVTPGTPPAALPPSVPPTPPVQWRVVYRNIYPGIDLATYRANGRIQYDLIVAPGADLSQVRIVYQGLEHVELTGTFPGYQIVNGSRLAVPVRIARALNRCYVLQADSYDSGTELIIPTTQAPLTAVTTRVAAR